MCVCVRVHVVCCCNSTSRDVPERTQSFAGATVDCVSAYTKFYRCDRALDCFSANTKFYRCDILVFSYIWLSQLGSVVTVPVLLVVVVASLVGIGSPSLSVTVLQLFQHDN